MFRLPEKNARSARKFEDLDMMACRSTTQLGLDAGSFTCVAGRCGLVATASFSRENGLVGLYLLVALSGKRVCEASFENSDSAARSAGQQRCSLPK